MPEEPQKTLEEQITDLIYKTIQTGGIGVGGVGAFWQLFKESDPAKAGASAVIGLMISYGATLLQPIHQGNKKRLEGMGKAADQKIDEMISQLDRWRGLDFESQYLQCQAWDCQEDEAIGLQNDEDLPMNNPLLQEVFVPLELATDSLTAGYETRELREKDCILQIWQLLQRVEQNPNLRQIAIRAWGGYGKTTLLKHLTYTYSVGKYKDFDAPKFIPFLLYLAGCWQEMIKENPPQLPQLLSTYHIQRILPIDEQLTVPENWAINLLKSGGALVMFDGFDEVPPAEREKVSQWLSGEMNKYRKNMFILTSRPTAYKDDFVAKKPTSSFWIQDFDEKQRRQFVEQWYLCQERHARAGRSTPDVEKKAILRANSLLEQIAARPELNDIAGNVLLLNMMARFHRDKQGVELPQRKVELYQDICELQLGRRPKAKKIGLFLNSSNQRQEVLQFVALEMMQRAANNRENKENFKRIGKDDLLQFLSNKLVTTGSEVEAESFLKQMVQVSELLVEKDRQSYQFSHSSFQEFLAASELFRLGEAGEQILYQALDAGTWKDVILFYGSLINPTDLIQKALNRNLGELAYLMYQQTDKRLNLTASERAALEVLKKNITQSWYQKLEELLIAKEWKDADEETYRLMITAVGKDEGQSFRAEDLKEFPCDELLAIDQLWVKHSNGLYGFSIQKDIYVKCGGKLDFSIPSDEVYDKFRLAIAWLENEEEGNNVIGLRCDFGIMSWEKILDSHRIGVSGHFPIASGEGVAVIRDSRLVWITRCNINLVLLFSHRVL